VDHDDPVTVSNFSVELGGEPVGFSEVLGLGFEPEKRRVTEVTLRRGAGVDDTLWRWARKPERRTVVITLLNPAREAVCRYVLQNALPVKISGPDLDARGTEVAIEEVVISAEGIEVEHTRR
jgi:phage tail-like protein